MNKEEARAKAKNWRKTETTQFLLRFMNSSGVPEAVNSAAKHHGITPSEYMKGVIVSALQAEGFLPKDAIWDYNAHRHNQKIQRLKEYIAAEEQKMKTE